MFQEQLYCLLLNTPLFFKKGPLRMFPLRLTFWEVPMKKNVLVISPRKIALIMLGLSCIFFFLLAGCEQEPIENSSDQTSVSSSQESGDLSSEISSSKNSQEESYNPWEGNPVVIPEDARPDESIMEKLRQAKASNRDVIGWLQLPGSGVDYPVVQAKG